MNRITSVQECDATDLNNSTTAWYIKKLSEIASSAAADAQYDSYHR